MGSTLVNAELGAGFRKNQVSDNELSYTKNRRDVLQRLSWGQVNEENYYTFLKTHFDFGQLSVHPCLRLDHMTFGYVEHLAAAYRSLQQAETILSPKLKASYSPGRKW
ncbi:MAG: hypothetical protein HKN87_08715 [Saprospiraceae bacterium]|nr:hypothetical protein [Saprospiraceae bacterium]